MPLVEKHPEPASVTEDSILEGPQLKIPLTEKLIHYSCIDYRVFRSIWYGR